LAGSKEIGARCPQDGKEGKEKGDIPLMAWCKRAEEAPEKKSQGPAEKKGRALRS